MAMSGGVLSGFEISGWLSYLIVLEKLLVIYIYLYPFVFSTISKAARANDSFFKIIQIVINKIILNYSTDTSLTNILER